MQRILSAIAIVTLAGCATSAPPPPAPRVEVPTGLERILGRDAATVTGLLGPATLDRREGPAHQLQFARGACVLDVFLYPEAGREVVRTASARRVDGTAMPAGDCLAALAR